MEHWLEQEILHRTTMRDRSDDPSHKWMLYHRATCCSLCCFQGLHYNIGYVILAGSQWLILNSSWKESFRQVVLNLGSIKPQGVVESVSGVQQMSRILRLFSTIPFLAERVKTFIHKHLKKNSFLFCWFCFFEHNYFVCNWYMVHFVH